MLRRPTFEPLFTTHPSQVGSTSLWTLFAAMLRTRALSPDLSRNDYFLCVVLSAIQGASAWSSCLLSAPSNRCVTAFHDCLSRQTALNTSSSHPWSRSTVHVPCSCLASTCSDVSSRPSCFEFFVMEGHISTISQF